MGIRVNTRLITSFSGRLRLGSVRLVDLSSPWFNLTTFSATGISINYAGGTGIRTASSAPVSQWLDLTTFTAGKVALSCSSGTAIQTSGAAPVSPWLDLTQFTSLPVKLSYSGLTSVPDYLLVTSPWFDLKTFTGTTVTATGVGQSVQLPLMTTQISNWYELTTFASTSITAVATGPTTVAASSSTWYNFSSF